MASMSPKQTVLVFFCKLQGFRTSSYTIRMDPRRTIGEVADVLGTEIQTNPDCIQFIHRGQVRRHDQTLADAEVTNDCTLFVTLADNLEYHYESDGEASARREAHRRNMQRARAGASSSAASPSLKPPGHTRDPVVFNYRVQGRDCPTGQLQMESYKTMHEVCEEVGGRHGFRTRDLAVTSMHGKIQNPEQTIEFANIAVGHTVYIILTENKNA